jgi:hypothetical protein
LPPGNACQDRPVYWLPDEKIWIWTRHPNFVTTARATRVKLGGWRWRSDRRRQLRMVELWRALACDLDAGISVCAVKSCRSFFLL